MRRKPSTHAQEAPPNTVMVEKFLFPHNPPPKLAGDFCAGGGASVQVQHALEFRLDSRSSLSSCSSATGRSTLHPGSPHQLRQVANECVPMVDSMVRAPLTHPLSATWLRMRGCCTRLRSGDASPCSPLPLAALSPAPWCHPIPLAPPKLVGGRGAAQRKLDPGRSADGLSPPLLRRLSSLTSRRGLGGACCRRRRRLGSPR